MDLCVIWALLYIIVLCNRITTPMEMNQTTQFHNKEATSSTMYKCCAYQITLQYPRQQGHMTSHDSHLTAVRRGEGLESRLLESFQLFLNLQKFLSLCVLPGLAVFWCPDLSVHVLHYVLHQPVNFLELRKWRDN